MAVYKVIQDIEAEDKLLGPLSLKGFIYFIIAIALLYLNLRLIMSGAPIVIKLPFFILMLLPAILFGTLASPLGREQPTEVWLLSRIRFALKPRTRIWNQSGQNDLVTITVPKRVEVQLTKNFSQDEVQSRLKALANTLDSRGWAVKNVNVNLNANPGYLATLDYNSDRLVEAEAVEEPVIEVHASDDIMDARHNPTAQKFEAMMEKADTERKKAVAAKIEAARKSPPQSTAHAKPKAHAAVQKAEPEEEGEQPVVSRFTGATIIAPHKEPAPKDPEIVTAKSSDEVRLLEQIHEREARFDALLANEHPKPTQRQDRIGKVAKPKPQTEVTTPAQADKIELAQSGNDLSVASIARLANRKAQAEPIPQEVTISLH
jgi:hypothetical protein